MFAPVARSSHPSAIWCPPETSGVAGKSEACTRVCLQEKWTPDPHRGRLRVSNCARNARQRRLGQISQENSRICALRA